MSLLPEGCKDLTSKNPDSVITLYTSVFRLFAFGDCVTLDSQDAVANTALIVEAKDQKVSPGDAAALAAKHSPPAVYLID
jgi:hypothetical protein